MRKLFKAVCIGIFVGVFGLSTFAPAFSYDIDTEFPYGAPDRTGEEAVDFGTIFKEDAVDPSDSASEQIQEAFNIDLDEDQRATTYIKEVINRVLAIVGLVALIVLLYGFYHILFSDSDDNVKSARKIVINALIALLVIGFAWIIVSQLFDVFFQVKEGIDS